MLNTVYVDFSFFSVSGRLFADRDFANAVQRVCFFLQGSDLAGNLRLNQMMVFNIKTVK